MTEDEQPSFSISALEFELWAEHEQRGGTFIVLLSMSLGSQRALGPIDCLIEALGIAAAAEALVGSLPTADGIVIGVQIVPMIDPKGGLK